MQVQHYKAANKLLQMGHNRGNTLQNKRNMRQTPGIIAMQIHWVFFLQQDLIPNKLMYYDCIWVNSALKDYVWKWLCTYRPSSFPLNNVTFLALGLRRSEMWVLVYHEWPLKLTFQNFYDVPNQFITTSWCPFLVIGDGWQKIQVPLLFKMGLSSWCILIFHWTQ